MYGIKPFSILIFHLLVSLFGKQSASAQNTAHSTKWVHHCPDSFTSYVDGYIASWTTEKNAIFTTYAKWGFPLRTLGCVAIKSLDTIAQHNEMAAQTFMRRYGRRGFIRISKEIQQEQKRQEKVANIVDNIDFVRSLIDKLATEHFYVDYEIDFTEQKYVYKVLVNRWIKDERTARYVRLYEMHVNSKTGKYNLISDIVREQDMQQESKGITRHPKQ